MKKSQNRIKTVTMYIGDKKVDNVRIRPEKEDEIYRMFADLLKSAQKNDRLAVDK